jgi:hypothetical protein
MIGYGVKTHYKGPCLCSLGGLEYYIVYTCFTIDNHL